MARKKIEDIPKGSPAWMNTFSDLMNLLLCFFVLLFAMSSVDTEKYEMVVQSLQQSFSVLPAGGTSINKSDGHLISSGVSALRQFDGYFSGSTSERGDQPNKGNNADSNKKNTGTDGKKSGDRYGKSTGKDGDIKDSVRVDKMSDKELKKEINAKGEKESEKISERIEKELEKKDLGNMVDVDFNGQYVEITMNGAFLFDPGRANLKKEAEPVLGKLSDILQRYSENLIQVEGHTDNVPQKSKRFENNDVLSMYRALYVADFVRSHTKINPAKIFSSGRGEYDPIADNSTPEGRAMNRRVTIKIYNSYNSK